MNETSGQQAAIKDRNAAHPIATAWRSTLREVVQSFVRGDFTLATGIRGVAPISPSTVTQIQSYLESNGETLAELPDETWERSVAQWVGPTHWEILVDLWTIEAGDDLRFEIGSVHVP